MDLPPRLGQMRHDAVRAHAEIPETVAVLHAEVDEMSTLQKVYGETSVFLGAIFPDHDLELGFIAENRVSRDRWFRYEDEARAWLATQVIRN